MATTGFILAAIDAGMIPDIMPSMIQMLNASITIFGEMKIGNGKTELNTTVNIQTKNSPINPPIKHRKALSNKNSVSIVLLLAPIAFFNPI